MTKRLLQELVYMLMHIAYVDFMSGSGVVADDFASLSDLRDTTKAFDRL